MDPTQAREATIAEFRRRGERLYSFSASPTHRSGTLFIEAETESRRRFSGWASCSGLDLSEVEIADAFAGI